MDTHELKIWPEYYNELIQGNKNFEIRKHDRDFQVDDILRLREWEESSKSYTGRESTAVITYILTNKEFKGLVSNYSALGIDVISQFI